MPDSFQEINIELRKQESLLTQIHAEMNAGFISKKREEQLWEVQRIITQLKRKLKNCEKKDDEDQEDSVDGSNSQKLSSSITTEVVCDLKSKSLISDDELIRVGTIEAALLNSELKISPESDILEEDCSGIRIHESGILILPESHPEYWTLIRLQIENEELLKWKNSLKIKINYERSEALRFKKILKSSEDQSSNYAHASPFEESDIEKIVDHFIKENALLEHKRNMLIHEIFEETKELLQFKTELTIKSFNVQ